MLAISGRQQIAPSVTDALCNVQSAVFPKLADNSGASFSENGFGTWSITRNATSQTWPRRSGSAGRAVAPVSRTAAARHEAVRSHFLALAGPESSDKIQRVLATREDAQHEAGFQNIRLRRGARANARTAKPSRLNEAALFEFAKTDRYADMIAALSLLCGAPMQLIESLLHSDHREHG